MSKDAHRKRGQPRELKYYAEQGRRRTKEDRKAAREIAKQERRETEGDFEL